jgi:hypothetical protein
MRALTHARTHAHTHAFRYDEVLGAYGEALTAVSEEIVAERKSATPSQDKILNCAFLLDYLTYNNLEHTVRANAPVVVCLHRFVFV